MMPKIISFDDAIVATKNQDRSLLMGNGFSIQHFSYQTLLKETNLEADEPLWKLFEAFDTFDFEAVIRSLDGAAGVEEVYGNYAQATQFRQEADRLRKALVLAIRRTHPSHRSDIEAQIPRCRIFLEHFSNYFTLNYDLLLYWVQLNTQGFNDGFGLGKEDGGFRGPFKEGARCNTYNWTCRAFVPPPVLV